MNLSCCSSEPVRWLSESAAAAAAGRDREAGREGERIGGIAGIVHVFQCASNPMKPRLGFLWDPRTGLAAFLLRSGAERNGKFTGLC